jgi:hypothetical protein
VGDHQGCSQYKQDYAGVHLHLVSGESLSQEKKEISLLNKGQKRKTLFEENNQGRKFQVFLV